MYITIHFHRNSFFPLLSARFHQITLSKFDRIKIIRLSMIFCIFVTITNVCTILAGNKYARTGIRTRRRRVFIAPSPLLISFESRIYPRILNRLARPFLFLFIFRFPTEGREQRRGKRRRAMINNFHDFPE